MCHDQPPPEGASDSASPCGTLGSRPQQTVNHTATAIGDLLSSLSRPQVAEIIEGKRISELQDRKNETISDTDVDVDCYPKPDMTIVRFTREEITSNWVYESENSSYHLVPHQSTQWMTAWFIDRNIIPPTFAPRFAWETQIVLPGGRQRRSAKTDELRKNCEGIFKNEADFFKVFVCSWAKSETHSCPSKLTVAICTSSFSPDGDKTIQIQCSWTSGCEHHKNDVQRGIVRKHRNSGSIYKTPRSICLQTYEKAHPLAVAAGNRTFGHLQTGPARSAKHLEKRMNYKFGMNVLGNISTIASELATDHQRSDSSGYSSFYGSVHDIEISNSGDLRSVSLYHALSVQVAAMGILSSKNSTAVIDCTGGVVADLWISTASDVARRALARSSKKKKKVSADGLKRQADVLNFHLVLPLPTGPFVALESLVVDKTAFTFQDILTKFRRRLFEHGPDAANIRYFVADMAVPFAIAVVSVFNDMNLPEYVSALLFAAKAGDESIIAKHVKTNIIWCDVHGDRAIRNKAKEFYRKSNDTLLNQMIMLFRNFRMALASSKTYRQLCLMIGFLNYLTSVQSFQILLCDEESKSEIVISEKILFEKGEALMWQNLGGVPSNTDVRYLHTVRVRACKAKGYNSSSYEAAVLEESVETGDTNNPVGSQSETGKKATDGISPAREDHSNSSIFEKEFLESVPEAKHGLYTYVIGPFHIHVVFREKCQQSGMSRYRVYIPALSLLPNSIGGFSLLANVTKRGTIIRNELYLDGRVRNYLQNQWFANVAMFCPVLLGEVPYTHNTSVEISFKILKNHTDLGIEARIQGKMDICEYIKKSANQKKAEASMVVGDLAQYYRKLRFDSKVAAKEEEKKKKKKKKTLSEVCKEKDLAEENRKLVSGVFRSKDGDRADNNKVKECVDPPKKERDDIPATQQSQSAIVKVEETWLRRKRKRATDDEKKEFREVFQTVVNTAFQGWSLRKVATFLNMNLLNAKGLGIDHSRISKLLSQKAFMSLELRAELIPFFSNELPKRAVDNEKDVVAFSLIPWVSKSLDVIISTPSPQEREPNVLASYGDARVTLGDIKRLVAREGRAGDNWISDEAVNMSTNLFSAMEGPQDCFYFSSLLLQNLYAIFHGAGSASGLPETEKLSQMERRAKRQGNTRPGQSKAFNDCKKAFWPCLVNGNHWIGFRIDKDSRRITSIDSLRNPCTDNAAKHGSILEVFLNMLEAGEWKYVGQDLSFPQQTNGIDCGILMLIGARNWKLEVSVPEGCATPTCTEKWRRRFSKEILVQRAS